MFLVLGTNNNYDRQRNKHMISILYIYMSKYVVVATLVL